MSLATINQSCKITGGSMQLFLYNYPVVAYTATGVAAQVAAQYSNLYTTGKSGTPLLTQWSLLDSAGIQLKYKSDVIHVDTNYIGKVPAGFGPPEITMEGNIIDINAAHLADIVNSTTNEVASATGSTGVFGTNTVAFGSARTVKYYGAIVRWLSPVVTTGTVTAWDHLLIPRLVIDPEMDLKFNRKDATMAKFSFMVLPDTTLLSLDSAQPIAGYYDSATLPAT